MIPWRINSHRTYRLFNVLFIGAIALISLYAFINPGLIQCPYADIGHSCNTCGLTRSFKAFFQGDLSQAEPAHLVLIIGLIAQIPLRLVLNFILPKMKAIRGLAIADSLFHFTYFAAVFYFIYNLG